MEKNSTYPLGLRWWHWLTAPLIFGLVATAFLPGTLLAPGTTAKQVRSVLAAQQVNINEDQSLIIGKALTDNTWLLHQYLGYGLVLLFIFRLVLEATGRSGRRLFPPLRRTATGAYPPPGRTVRSIYLFFYLVLAVAVVTGICLSLVPWYPGLQYYRLIRILHQATLYFVLLFTPIHIGGVLLAERRQQTKGIVSGMINGGARDRTHFIAVKTP